MAVIDHHTFYYNFDLSNVLANLSIDVEEVYELIRDLDTIINHIAPVHMTIDEVFELFLDNTYDAHGMIDALPTNALNAIHFDGFVADMLDQEEICLDLESESVTPEDHTDIWRNHEDVVMLLERAYSVLHYGIAINLDPRHIKQLRHCMFDSDDLEETGIPSAINLVGDMFIVHCDMGRQGREVSPITALVERIMEESYDV